MKRLLKTTETAAGTPTPAEMQKNVADLHIDSNYIPDPRVELQQVAGFDKSQKLRLKLIALMTVKHDCSYR